MITSEEYVFWLCVLVIALGAVASVSHVVRATIRDKSFSPNTMRMHMFFVFVPAITVIMSCGAIEGQAAVAVMSVLAGYVCGARPWDKEKKDNA